MEKFMVIVLLLLLVTVVFVAGCSSASNNQPSQTSYGGGCGVAQSPLEETESTILAEPISEIADKNGF